jgi:hypothetical protein
MFTEKPRKNSGRKCYIHSSIVFQVLLKKVHSRSSKKATDPVQMVETRNTNDRKNLLRKRLVKRQEGKWWLIIKIS